MNPIPYPFLINMIPFLGISFILISSSIFWKAGKKDLAQTVIFSSYLLFFILCILHIANAPVYTHDWNARRMLPSFALLGGHKLYFLSNQGPVIMGLNGPITVLAYLPAALFRNPILCVWLGSLLSSLYFFAPAFLIITQEGRSHFRSTNHLQFLCFGFFSLFFISLTQSAFRIHADAPGLGLSCLSVFCILTPYRRQSAKWLFLSALVAGLAFFSKMVFLPVSVGIAVFLLFTEGFRTFFRYLVYLLAIFLLLFGVAVFSFGLQEVLYNFLLPINQLSVATETGTPTRTHVAQIKGLVREGFTFFSMCYAFLFIVLISISLNLNREIKSFFREEPWIPVFWISVCLFPVTLLGRLKHGGEMNTYSPSLYFLILASLLALNKLFNLKLKKNETYKTAIATLALCVVLVLPQIHYYSWPIRYLFNNADLFSKKILEKEKGRYFFPDFPLSHFLVENQIYHSGMSLVELSKGNYAPSNEGVRRFIPKDREFIVFEDDPNSGIEIMSKYLTEYRRIPTPAQFAGWVVYQKP
jgi:hypothetical protein